MKVDSRKLNDAISVASKWVPARPIIEGTGGYLFSFDDSLMTISAVNPVGSDISLEIPIVGEPIKGPVLVKAKQLNRTINSMATISEEIEISIEKKGLVLKCGKHKTIMATMSIDEFPELRTRNTDSVEIIDPQEFVNAVSKVKGVANPEDPRRNLSCIYFNNGDVVTTDGQRMAIKYGFKIAQEPILVPVDFCINIATALANVVGDISCYLDEYTLYLEWEGGSISASTVDMPYPDYPLIIPESYTTEMKIAPLELSAVLKLVAPFAVDSLNLLVLKIKGDAVIMESMSSIGSHTSEIIPKNMSGEEVTVGLSYKYLNDAVSVLDGEIHMGLNGSQNIIILSNSKDYIYGIMPMHIT